MWSYFRVRCHAKLWPAQRAVFEGEIQKRLCSAIPRAADLERTVAMVDSDKLTGMATALIMA